MPDQRRFRRLKFTSAAISAGAFAVVIAGAHPANAADCPAGDPAAVLKNIQCTVQKAGQGLPIGKPAPKAPAPSTAPSSSPPKTGPAGSPAGGTAGGTAAGGTTSAAPRPGSAGTGLVPPPAQSAGALPRLPPGGASQDVVLPGLASDQTPQVAWEQQPPLVYETHLIAPAASSGLPGSSVSPLVVAVAVAGTVGALNLGVATRGRLRRLTGRRLAY